MRLGGILRGVDQDLLQLLVDCQGGLVVQHAPGLSLPFDRAFADECFPRAVSPVDGSNYDSCPFWSDALRNASGVAMGSQVGQLGKGVSRRRG